MASSPSILFMGTPQFAATSLTGLVEAGFDVIGVVTRPDKESGRGGKISPSEVKIEAEKHRVPVYEPANKAELTETVRRLVPELIIVAAYGMIIPQEVLDIPRFGALNIHGSLLPKYRGASPIAEAILAGDKETGITIMQMSIGMDEGDIIIQYKLPISFPVIPSVAEESLSSNPEGSLQQPARMNGFIRSGGGRDDNVEYDTTASLTAKMAKLGAKAIVETIPGWVHGTLKAIPQNNAAATYCKKITKEDGHIDWTRSAVQIERLVRAYTPWPTAYTFVNNVRLKILKTREIPGLRPGMTKVGALNFDSGHTYITTGEGTLEILELQPEGKKPMPAKDFINGNKDLNGGKLT